ncbi:hypothetical protein F1C58_10565 [Glaciihabitans sp. INWT7]|uniref:hypothetical protein n=1 Tax=Glaciihabitans sp. INWT7 TaxID=2596912 RepID=UPI00162A4027|nr:hypothetical protein [Glaciihabitans sp. INWT7]QNE47293.1 hypothetical protein F1C58_10565 [Glaciihabitans sp. INWT7]
MSLYSVNGAAAAVPSMVVHRGGEHNALYLYLGNARATSRKTAYSQGTRGAIRAPDPRELTMADKSPKKSTSKTAASKSLKEKRADKKTKAANKPNG